jgi:putative peptidoglycan lipid II flippase
VTDDPTNAIERTGAVPGGNADPGRAMPGPSSPTGVTGPGPSVAQATTARALARAGAIVTAAVIASRVLGYLRYVFINRAVPDVAQLDAFFAAFRIPDFLFQLVAAGALSSALVPVIAALLATHEEQRAWRVVSTILTLMLAALAVLALIVFAFADVLVPPITDGLSDEAVAKTVELTRIMVLSPLFLATGAVATSVLNASHRFGAAAFAPLVYNLAIIGAAVFLAPSMGVTGLAIGVVLGAMGHMLVQIPQLRRGGVRIRPRADLHDPAARKALTLLAPRALGLGAVQFVFIVVTSIAAGLGTGAITAFNFSFALLQIPIGVIGVPLGVVLLPSLAREAATGGDETFRRVLVRALRILAYVMIPIAAIGAVVASDVVTLLFDHGATDRATLTLAGDMLAVFMFGLVAHSLIAVLARAFYAVQDTRTPVSAAIVAVVLDIGLALMLSERYGMNGVAAAVAVGAWAETVILVVLLERRVPRLGLRGVGRVAVLTIVATVPATIVAWLVEEALVDAWGPYPERGFLTVLLRLVIVAGAGGLVFLGGSLALRIPELPAMLSLMTDLIRRRRAQAA